MAIRVVTGVDTYTWNEPDTAGPPGAKLRKWAERGDTIEISDDEAHRGDTMLVTTVAGRSIYALSTEKNAETALAVTEPTVGWHEKSDDEINAMSVEDVHAYLNSVPEDQQDAEVERVLELEELRDRPRVGVTALANNE